MQFLFSDKHDLLKGVENAIESYEELTGEKPGRITVSEYIYDQIKDFILSVFGNIGPLKNSLYGVSVVVDKTINKHTFYIGKTPTR